MTHLKPRTTLYFIRHGETDWNKAGRLQGQLDIPLNDTGRGQAERNGRALAELVDGLDGLPFVASPLLRTRETIEIARAAAGLPREGYLTDDRLKEVNYGHWEGVRLDELRREDPVGFRERQTNKFHWCPIGGESYGDLSARVATWLGDVEGTSVVVSHGGVSRVLRGLLLGLDVTEIPMLEVPQDRIMVLEEAGGRVLLSWA